MSLETASQSSLLESKFGLRIHYSWEMAVLGMAIQEYMALLDKIKDPTGRKFNVSGPKHLREVDWENSGHRRSVAACLVKGVYVAERDRQKSRGEYEARAPEWWEFFHFKVIQTLIDEDDSSIFGAVYQFNPPTATTTTEAPRYVIAFRGNFLHRPTVSQSIKLDARFAVGRLHRTSSFELAWRVVRRYVSDVGPSNVWLAGHSLGSSFATLVGKNMARKGVFLKSFLFNPPFLPNPIDLSKVPEELKKLIHIFRSDLTALLSKAADAFVGKPKSEDSFANLSPWLPCLFVNKADFICSGYVEYFQSRETAKVTGATKTGQVATKNSDVALLLTRFGKDADPVHLLPSADLTFHGSPPRNPLIFFKAHKLRQWWQPDLQLECKEYRYKHRNAK